MSATVLVRARGLAKSYRRYAHPRDRLVEWLTLGRVQRHQSFTALQPVDLEVHAGECLGIVGENGAGKSTLLKLISGVLSPTSGTIHTEGRVVSLLELGTGFNPELDGLQNIFTSAQVLGVRASEVRARLDAILAFAELGEFLHQPVKTYSSGMYMRLAFALFAFLDPAVYIVDEALAVGDVFFQQKCFAFLESLKQRGVAVVLASHDMQAVLRLADSVLLLEHGRTILHGAPIEVVNAYYARHGIGRIQAPEPRHPAPVSNGALDVPSDGALDAHALRGRRGNGSVRIEAGRFLDAQGATVRSIERYDSLRLQVFARANCDVDDLTIGFQITDRLNTVIFGQTVYQKDRSVLSARAGELLLVEFDLPMLLAEGTYIFFLGATDCQTEVSNQVYDAIEHALVLEVQPARTRASHGLVELPMTYRIVRSSAPMKAT